MKNSKEKITREIRIPSNLIREMEDRTINLPSFQEVVKSSLKKDTSVLLNVIMTGGVVLGSSDIHIEPEEERVKLRIRVDGVLQDVISIRRNLFSSLLSRLKLLSEMKLNVSDRPQDGRFSILIPSQKESFSVEIRVSALPSEHGETIVMRLLDPRKLITIEDLGLRSDLYQIFKKEISRPNGMVIVTGPTGSGKTTTLYAFLKYIKNPQVKIITIEDPIEYHIEGISQTEARPDKGYDFANGLKAIVRQDPDAILVGEIRDLETASISLQAALTGHIVFSTLHTNDAAGAIPRLQALGEKAVNIAPALNLIIAQRLVRRVCSRCKEMISIEDSLFEKIDSLMKEVSREIISYSRETEIVSIKGCKECNFTGYRGRVGVYEALVVDEEIEQLILQSPSISDIKKESKKRGLLTLQQDALIKVLEGKTTIEEVERVIGL